MADQFMEMTGTKDGDLADFYISSAAGDVNKAVNLYFESVKGSAKIKTLGGNSNNTNTFFAGGEKSGVLLQGEPDIPDKNDLVKDILNLASQSKPFDDEPQVSKFNGSGYTLGSSDSSAKKDEEEIVKFCI